MPLKFATYEGQVCIPAELVWNVPQRGKYALFVGVQAKRDFMPMISRDGDMIFSIFGFIGSHAVWFYNGTLLFIDLGSKLLYVQQSLFST